MKGKVFTWVLVILVLFWLVTDPQGLAESASSLGSTLSSWAEQLLSSLIAFARELG